MENHTTALSIYAISCVYERLHSLSTGMYTFANIYSVLLVRVWARGSSKTCVPFSQSPSTLTSGGHSLGLGMKASGGFAIWLAFLSFFFIFQRHCKTFHPSKFLNSFLDSASNWPLPLEMRIHRAKGLERERRGSEGEREREGASGVIDQRLAPFHLSADLLPLSIELLDVFEFHACRAHCLHRWL